MYKCAICGERNCKLKYDEEKEILICENHKEEKLIVNTLK